MAEAYLNSLEVQGCSVLSSGTTAASDKARNLVFYRKTLALLEKHGIREFAKADYGDQLTQSRLEKTDIAICMNPRVYDECLRIVSFPASPYLVSRRCRRTGQDRLCRIGRAALPGRGLPGNSQKCRSAGLGYFDNKLIWR